MELSPNIAKTQPSPVPGLVEECLTNILTTIRRLEENASNCQYTREQSMRGSELSDRLAVLFCHFNWRNYFSYLFCFLSSHLLFSIFIPVVCIPCIWCSDFSIPWIHSIVSASHSRALSFGCYLRDNSVVLFALITMKLIKLRIVRFNLIHQNILPNRIRFILGLFLTIVVSELYRHHLIPHLSVDFFR